MTATGEKVSWLNTCHFLYTKDADVVQFRYDFHQQFREIPIRTAKSLRNQTEFDLAPTSAYSEELPIEETKKKDLQTLCNRGVIPEIYHRFYNSLTCVKKVNMATEERCDGPEGSDENN